MWVSLSCFECHLVLASSNFVRVDSDLILFRQHPNFVVVVSANNLSRIVIEDSDFGFVLDFIFFVGEMLCSHLPSVGAILFWHPPDLLG